MSILLFTVALRAMNTTQKYCIVLCEIASHVLRAEAHPWKTLPPNKLKPITDLRLIHKVSFQLLLLQAFVLNIRIWGNHSKHFLLPYPIRRWKSPNSPPFGAYKSSPCGFSPPVTKILLFCDNSSKNSLRVYYWKVKPTCTNAVNCSGTERALNVILYEYVVLFLCCVILAVSLWAELCWSTNFVSV